MNRVANRNVHRKPGRVIGRLLWPTLALVPVLAATAASAQTAGQPTSDTTTINLAPMTVEAETESAFGPVSGYVANRSAAGTKTDTPLVETPQSVSAVTRDDIDARGARNLGEALSYTAGVATGRRGESNSFGGDNIAIRGFAGDGTAGASGSEYADGLRLRGTNYVVSGFDPYLYERIDVLKGPASVLYGQGTPGGVINAISRRPRDVFGGEVQFQVGSYDRLQGAFDVTGPLDRDKTVLYRLTGLKLDSDTQTDFMERDRDLIAPAVTWRPRADTTLTLLASYQHDDIKGTPLNSVPAYGSVLSNPNGDIPSSRYVGEPGFDRWDRSSYSIGYLFEHRFDDTWTVRQNARYQNHELDWKVLFPGALAANGRTLSRTAFTAVENSHNVAIDNQVQAKVTTGPLQHTVLVGLDYARNRSDTLRGQAAAPTLDLYAPVYGYTIADPPIYQSLETRASQLGLYAQDQIKLGGWNLLLGGRRDWADTKTRNRLNGASSGQDDTAFTGRAGLLYLFDSGLAPYVSYAESFDPASGTDYSGAPFEPTTGTQYEAGVKFQPPGYNSVITLAIFNIEQQNVLTSDPAHTGFSVQTGEVRSRGIEIEGKASLDRGLDLLFAYSLTDVEVTESNGTDKGKVPVAVPRHQASLWADYTVQAGAMAGLGLGAGVRYVGESWGDTTNTIKVPSYTVFDAAVHYDLSQLSPSLAGAVLAVNATNLFDRDYVASCTRATSCYYGTARTVIGTLKYQW